MYTESEVKLANRTSRSSGAVGCRAVTPTYVFTKLAKPSDKILDFGAGKDACHARMWRERGFNVTAYEFGDNVSFEFHDEDALKQEYDIVYASNVLNVCSSESMVRHTLEDIYSAVRPNGIAVFNYPQSPRKADVPVYQIICEVFGTAPQLVGGINNSPIWQVRKE